MERTVVAKKYVFSHFSKDTMADFPSRFELTIFYNFRNLIEDYLSTLNRLLLKQTETHFINFGMSFLRFSFDS